MLCIEQYINGWVGDKLGGGVFAGRCQTLKLFMNFTAEAGSKQQGAPESILAHFHEKTEITDFLSISSKINQLI